MNGALVVFDGQLKRGPNRHGHVLRRDRPGPVPEERRPTRWRCWCGTSASRASRTAAAARAVRRSSPTSRPAPGRVGWSATPAGSTRSTRATRTTPAAPRSTSACRNRTSTTTPATPPRWPTRSPPASTTAPGSAPTYFGAAGAAPWNGLVERPVAQFRYSGLKSYINATLAPGHRPGLHRDPGHPAVQHPGHPVPEGRRSGRPRSSASRPTTTTTARACWASTRHHSTSAPPTSVPAESRSSRRWPG